MLWAGNLIAAQTIKLKAREHRAVGPGEGKTPAIGHVSLAKGSIFSLIVIGKGLKLASSYEILLDLNRSTCRKSYRKAAIDSEYKHSSQENTRLITSIHRMSRPERQAQNLGRPKDGHFRAEVRSKRERIIDLMRENAV